MSARRLKHCGAYRCSLGMRRSEAYGKNAVSVRLWPMANPTVPAQNESGNWGAAAIATFRRKIGGLSPLV
jgi:hypothetical protein